MFDELADGVYRRHYEFLRLNIGVVVGGDGVLVVDTRESHEAAAELAHDIRSLTDLPVRWVVNTHAHWDHTFGNAVFPDAEIWGHLRCRQWLIDDPDEHRRGARHWMPEDRHAEVDEVSIVPPGETFEAVAHVDMGDRVVRLGHHGRGHTDNDIVVHAESVTFMGDLVEEGGAPYMGDGFLLDWPSTLGVIAPLAGDVVVPGHGACRSRDWIADQRRDMETVAERLRDVLLEGRPLVEAAARGPFPESDMRQALERGIAAAGAAPA